MAKALLSDTKIRNAKAASDGKPYKLTDGEGLFVRVMPSGSRLWQMKYRLGGKEHSYSIGQYPEIGLQRARKEHAKARELVRIGEHPIARREVERLEKALAGADTLMGICEEWISKKQEGWSAYYLKQKRRELEMDVYPTLGKLPVRSLTVAHLRPLIQKIEGRGPLWSAISTALSIF